VFISRRSTASLGALLPAVLQWLRRCFHRLHINESYGISETGAVANDGRIVADVDVGRPTSPPVSTPPPPSRAPSPLSAQAQKHTVFGLSAD